MRSENVEQQKTTVDHETTPLPEGTEHVVVQEQPNRQAPEYRMPAARLQQYDGVDVSEYIDDEDDVEGMTVIFEPGDEIPLAVAADGTYSSFREMFACFDADQNRLDGTNVRNDSAIRQWKAQN